MPPEVLAVRQRQRAALRDLRRLLTWQTCLESCPAWGGKTPARKLQHARNCPEGQLRRAIRELDASTKAARA